MSIIRNIFIKIASAEEGDSTGVIFNNPVRAESITGLIAVLLDFVSKVGAAIAVFMVIYSGFLFVKAQGDPAQIETAKKTFLWTVIGGVVLIGAKTLAEVIKNTATGLGVGIM